MGLVWQAAKAYALAGEVKEKKKGIGQEKAPFLFSFSILAFPPPPLSISLLAMQADLPNVGWIQPRSQGFLP